MKGLVYVFPGQGSQKVGMGRALCAQSEPARGLFAQADAILGAQFSQVCWEGPAEGLTDTVNAQPAILTTSLALLAEARAAGAPAPEAFAGHSLGHFSALAAAGALDFADALRLVRVRGEAMKAAGQANPGSMAAVMKLEAEKLALVCQQAASETGRYVGIANDNAPDQVVITGAAEAVERASQLAKEAGAKRVVPLAVSIAAHSPLMQSAVEVLRRQLDATSLRAPQATVISNVTAAPLRTPQEMQADILNQLTRPVKWTASIHALVAAGARTFVEIGPGSVLTGLIKRIAPAAEAWSLDEGDGLAKLLALANT
jgi:[acyl-carrier-protein] S-malonyltransferase